MDNIRQKIKRTSFSMDERTFSALQRASKLCKYKSHELAIIATKEFIKTSKFHQKDKIGVMYNGMICKNKIFPYLSLEEQFSLRQIRALYGVSISFLICKSVELFLCRIVFMLVHNYAYGKAWLKKIESYLTNTYFYAEKKSDGVNSFRVVFFWTDVGILDYPLLI